MLRMIEDRLQIEIRSKYKTLDKKLNHLSQQQKRTPQLHHSFYPRVINTTDITFSEQEMTLLEKGPKHNLHSRPTYWIRNLALEAETAIIHLPPPPPQTEKSYRKLTAERISTLIKKITPTHTQHTPWSENSQEHKNKTKIE